MKFPLLCILTLIFISGVGCAIETEAINRQTNQTPLTTSVLHAPAAALSGTWEVIAPGLQRLQYRFAPDTYSTIILYKIDPTQYRLRLVNDTARPQRVDQWLTTLPNALLVINGFFFNEDFSPTGLLKTDTTTLNAAHFNTWPGLLDLTDVPRIINLRAQPYDLDGLTVGGDSFPLLLNHGAITIDDSDTATNRRSFIATDTTGNIYLGTIPSATVTFYQLATIIKQIPDIDWDMALNLDGGSSTGLSSRVAGHEENLYSYAQVPSVVVVEKK